MSGYIISCIIELRSQLRNGTVFIAQGLVHITNLDLPSSAIPCGSGAEKHKTQSQGLKGLKERLSNSSKVSLPFCKKKMEVFWQH